MYKDLNEKNFNSLKKETDEHIRNGKIFNAHGAVGLTYRSEERRVGKECT